MATGNFVQSDGQRVEIFQGRVYVNSEHIPQIRSTGCEDTIVQQNGKLYINGYENKKGKWRKTLRARLICLFA